MSKTTIKHPARYNDDLLPFFAEMLRGRTNVLDPFAGTGKIYQLNHYLPDIKIYAVEIEPEWAAMSDAIVGSAVALPFPDATFDAICTSPCYGNRMADKLMVEKDTWKKKHKYITYAQHLGRNVSAGSSASMQWGEEYQRFHVAAWQEARRVLKPYGTLVLNIKNHIRGGVEQHVTQWHIAALHECGFRVSAHTKVALPSMRFGQNRQARISYESVIKFIRSN